MLQCIARPSPGRPGPSAVASIIALVALLSCRSVQGQPLDSAETPSDDAPGVPVRVEVDVGPELRAGIWRHGVAPWNGGILMIGGDSRSRVADNCQWIDRFGDEWSWRNCPELERSRRDLRLTETGPGLVVSGGRHGDELEASVWVLARGESAWREVGVLAAPRIGHTATAMGDGRVLVAGGVDAGGATLASCEIVDTRAGTVSGAAPMNAARSEHAAVALSDGRVLVIGGRAGGEPLDTAELFDPRTGEWRTTASLPAAMFGHTATQLRDGRVLVVGGVGSEGGDEQGLQASPWFEPAGQMWVTGPAMAVGRHHHTASLLPSGHLLVAGGAEGPDGTLLELFDPGENRWLPVGHVSRARRFHTATDRGDGRLLLVGGIDPEEADEGGAALLAETEVVALQGLHPLLDFLAIADDDQVDRADVVRSADAQRLILPVSSDGVDLGSLPDSASVACATERRGWWPLESADLYETVGVFVELEAEQFHDGDEPVEYDIPWLTELWVSVDGRVVLELGPEALLWQWDDERECPVRSPLVSRQAPPDADAITPVIELDVNSAEPLSAEDRAVSAALPGGGEAAPLVVLAERGFRVVTADGDSLFEYVARFGDGPEPDGISHSEAFWNDWWQTAEPEEHLRYDAALAFQDGEMGLEIVGTWRRRIHWRSAQRGVVIDSHEINRESDVDTNRCRVRVERSGSRPALPSFEILGSWTEIEQSTREDGGRETQEGVAQRFYGDLDGGRLVLEEVVVTTAEDTLNDPVEGASPDELCFRDYEGESVDAERTWRFIGRDGHETTLARSDWGGGVGDSDGECVSREDRRGEAELLREVDDADMIRIEGGTLHLGLDEAELAAHREACEASGSSRCTDRRFGREHPGIERTVDTFFIDEHEVTRAQYDDCVEAGYCPPIDESRCSIYYGGEWVTGRSMSELSSQPAAPRTCVTRLEAAVYCWWVGARLPTEIEWEMAAAGPEGRIFAWGNDYQPAAARNLDETLRYLDLATDGVSGRTPQGLFHMSGNAYEWVSTPACPYSEWPEAPNLDCREGERGVIRGGSFLSDGGGIRTTYRRFIDIDARVDTNGFRCALSAD